MGAVAARPAAVRAAQRGTAAPLRARAFASGAASAPLDIPPRGIDHPITYHPDFRVNPVPEGHRFPMPKDEMLYQRLVAEGLAGRTFTPRHADRDTLALAHSREYVDKVFDGKLSAKEQRALGLPWCPDMVRRATIGVGSAVLAARLAMQFGVAAMCNGGTHHAHRDRGGGWCVFNDLAVAACALRRDADVDSILFVDCDVHRGDGTASIFADAPDVFTFSLHCAGQSFPPPPGTKHGARGECLYPPGDLDVEVPRGVADDEYVATLERYLTPLLEGQWGPRKSTGGGRPQVVMYNAGVDVHEDDSLGAAALTMDGIRARDELVLESCARAGVPVVAAIGGGYAEDHATIVDRHMHLHRAARRVYNEYWFGRTPGVAARAQQDSAAK
ncbi:unnamed protein product [Pedinophyceae sp. YPF-701]|nr:unnamed protein product [Pedinophyceae sp. YPF-701]